MHLHRSQQSSLTASPWLTLLILTAFSLALGGCAPGDAGSGATGYDRTYDLVIYGGTSSAVAAAVQASRMGQSVVIVCPDTHLGGLSAGGLGWTDSGNKAVIGGVAREFYQAVKRHYDDPKVWTWQAREECSGYRPGDDAMWVFEPHVAEWIFETMLAAANVPVYRDHWLLRPTNESPGGVEMQRGRIAAITMANGRTFRGRMFIDASYEGDLLAATGVPYTVGREANSTYGETLNGVQTGNAIYHQFGKPIDPYRVSGYPDSGLLPRLHADGPGEEGEGDHRLQAYNYRLCLTNVEKNRVPFPKPDGYDPRQYELLLRHLQADPTQPFCTFSPMPNGKTDTNNNGAFSTDNIGMNYDYPDASYQRRREILREHVTYQQGLFYFLANDPRVPSVAHERIAPWGLAADEFRGSNHWPHQIYVREARRMVSDFTTTERHLRGLETTPKSIGMGSYNMDSHNVQRYLAFDEDGTAYVRNEGDVQVNPGGAYPISYEAIVPPRAACTNLLVPVCLSSSHIAYGSIRMEPVFMILGQSAATAAALAQDADIDLQDLDYAALEERLLADGQVLRFGRPRAERGIDPATLPGIVVDDTLSLRTGIWTESNSVAGYVGRSYLHSEPGDEAVATFRLQAPASGPYELRMSYTPHNNRASNVPIHIVASHERIELAVNQRVAPTVAGLFTRLAILTLVEGDPVLVSVSTEGADGYVIVDAVQLVAAQ
jgi:FAD dependent oxidoreductase